MFIAQKLKIFSFIMFLIIVFSFNINANEVKIIAKVNNQIITNIDVQNELNYLIALNSSLQKIDKSKVKEFARESIIREKIKLQEISKNFESNKENEVINNFIENIYKNLGINSKNEFINYLKEFNLDYEKVYKKIEIEFIWNQLIYEKYKNKISIDQEDLKNKILNNKKKLEHYLLSELIFDINNKNEINSKYMQILNSIKTIGFKESVVKFSIADSKKNFGSIGWVIKDTLSDKIKDNINNLKKGEISKPIVLNSGVLILKLEDKKLTDENINLNEELEKNVQKEINNQLNNYSIIYLNKIKNNTNIYEF